MEFQGRGVAVEAGGRRLVADLDFDLERGRTLVVRGPSGIGKSQLLRFLACLSAAGTGELRLDGRTPAEVGPQAWRAEVCGRLVAMQSKIDGSWTNQNSPRWYEGNPLLATSYALLALEAALPPEGGR